MEEVCGLTDDRHVGEEHQNGRECNNALDVGGSSAALALRFEAHIFVFLQKLFSY
jgi:hypothetical protein